MKKILLLAAAFSSAAFASEASAGLSVHGHKGTRGTRPENTLPAFEEALRAGVDVLEMDLAVTKDGYLVVSHDPYVTPARCLGRDGTKLSSPVAIRSLTLEELRRYDCGSQRNPAFPRQETSPGAGIPTLDEVFGMVSASTIPAARTVEFNIETKIFPWEPTLAPDPDEFARLTAETVVRNQMENRVIAQSFDSRTLRALKKIEPAIRTSQLTHEELLDIVPALKSANTDIWSPNYRWITADAVKAVRAAGIKVAPWTVNTEEEWNAVMALGVDAIITDYPADLIGYLKSKKLR